MTKALVVLSGGQDSTTCLGWALANHDHVSCITFNYGQRHSAEITAAIRVVSHFMRHYEVRKIPHELLYLPEGILQGSSPLTNPNETLETYANHDEMAKIIGDRVEKTFVPMRNALFLTIAANRAAAHGYDSIVTGVCEADNANYPDCTSDFIDVMEGVIDEALGGSEILIETPLITTSKADSIRLALDLPFTYAALAFSHTAYDGQYPPVSKDHASVLRAHGFEQADRPDPLVLRAVYEGLMDLPTTPNYAQAASFTDALKGDWS